MNNIEKLWKEIPEGAINVIEGDSFLDCIPFSPKCISGEDLRSFLKISKSTLSYYVKKFRKKLHIFSLKKKNYYQRIAQNGEANV